MKKFLGLMVLMMVMLISVSGLAQVSDTEVVVPVFLNVPQFVRLSVADPEADNAFNLVFDPTSPDAVISDTVQLLAEANVNYSISSEKEALAGYENWVELLNVTINNTVLGFGAPGSVTFDTTVTIDVINNLDTALPVNTQIANVTFTILGSI